MKNLLTAIALAAPMAASAGLINGSFEDGFTGWSIETPNGGSAAVKTFDEGYTPTGGDYFANLTADASISQALSWFVGDVLSFDWAFNAQGYLPFNDFSLFTLADTGGTIFQNTMLSDVLAVGDYGSTPWDTFEYTFGSTGSGVLNIGVWNLLDTALDSELNIDQVAMSSNDIPEPSTALLLGVGLLGLSRFRRKNG